MENISEYKEQLLTLLWNAIPTKLKGYVISSKPEEAKKDIEDMVSLKRNEYGEYDLLYPDYIPAPWSDYYENNKSVEKAYEELLPGVIDLLNSSASVM